jgi:hypothetical protein
MILEVAILNVNFYDPFPTVEHYRQRFWGNGRRP